MLGFNGGLIGKTRTVGRSQILPGIWILQEQVTAQRQSSWPVDITQLYLDPYPFAAGFSLRNLYRSYNDSVVLVRRSSDNSEQAFTASGIMDGTMLAWVGSGDGFVKTWYDQSGNNRHATQTTASSQPLIVQNGGLITYNGNPTIYLDNRSGFATGYDPGTSYTFFLAGRNIKGGNTRMINSSSNQLMTFNRNGNAFQVSGGVTISDTSGVPGSSYAIGTLIKRASGSANGYINGQDRTSNSAATAAGTWPALGIGSVGTFSGETPLANYLDFLVYATDQTQNRQAIESVINLYYGIY